jgi:hypothetical protein
VKHRRCDVAFVWDNFNTSCKVQINTLQLVAVAVDDQLARGVNAHRRLALIVAIMQFIHYMAAVCVCVCVWGGGGVQSLQQVVVVRALCVADLKVREKEEKRETLATKKR